MMLKLLKMQWPAETLLPAFEKIGLSAQARAETVSLDEFVALTKALQT
jgi:hypothetical protein